MTIFSATAIENAYKSKFNGVVNGTVTDIKNGSGSFAEIIAHQNGTATTDKITTFANGKTAETKTSITQNTDGSYSETITNLKNGVKSSVKTITVSADGSTINKTVQAYKADGSLGNEQQTTITGNADGSETETGTLTLANGKVDTLTETLTDTASGLDTSETLTNAAGKTATVSLDSTKSGNTTTSVWNDVNFAGVTSTDTATQTILDRQST